jgi:hypothetical protein
VSLQEQETRTEAHACTPTYTCRENHVKTRKIQHATSQGETEISEDTKLANTLILDCYVLEW